MAISTERLIYRAFNKIHDQLALLDEYMERLGDPVADGLLRDVVIGTLKPMRRLRSHLEIPYTWKGRKYGSESDDD